MALIPNSNLVGLPEVTATDLKSNDPSRLNRVLRLLATQIKQVQTGAASSVTNITNVNTASGGGSSSSSTPIATVVTVQGTHQQRLSSFLPASEPAGSYYYEIDRTVTYLNFLAPSTDQVWQWVSGTMRDVFSNRPVDLGQYDAGFVFYATDQNLLFEWDGTIWAQYIVIEPVLQDVYANWTAANYPPANYAPATLFVVMDRNWIYSVEIVSTVNTWVLVDGTYGAVTASRPSTGFDGGALGANDTGMLFVDTTLKIIERWSGAAWVQVPDVPASAVLLASNSSKQITAAALASGEVYIGSVGNLPIAQPLSGAITVTAAGLTKTAATGVVTPGSYTSANITVTADGIITAAANGSSGGSFASFTPTLTFGGLAVAIAGTFTGEYLKVGNMVCVSIVITLTNKGTSTGSAVVAGLPFPVSISGTGALDSANMLLMTAPYALASSATSAIALNQTGATGGAAMTDANFTNTSSITLSLFYGS